MFHARHPTRPKRRGAATVEFALVLPVFLAVLLGIIEVGRLIMVQQVMTNASREGARVAVLNGSTTQDVRDAVVEYLADSSIALAPEDVTCEPDPGTAASGAPITVSITLAFQDVSWVPGGMVLGDINLQAAATMRKEVAQ